MEQLFDILIVGGGHGGAQAASLLRQKGFSGTLAIIGEEPDPPYERPPLSKEYLAGEKDFARLLIHAPDFWAQKEIGLLTGRRVARVDPAAHWVETEGGEIFGYGQLVWAAGGHPRRLSCVGHDVAGLHCVRTRRDVDAIGAALGHVEHVVIVGGGYVGLEAAAAIKKRGKVVTVLENQDRVLARVAGEPLSRFYEEEHGRHGVDIRLAVAIEAIEENAGRVSGVRLTTGEILPAEMVIVGIGIVPSVGPLIAAGAEGGNGVLVDSYGRTSLADIYALGDCALHHNTFSGGAVIRLESVQNANDMAATVVATILGQPKAYAAVPWFWSNQYDLKLQTVGLSMNHDEAVLRGDPKTRSFSVVYLREGRVIALDCVNAVKDYVQGRSLVLAGAHIPSELLSDATQPLKALAEAVSAA